MGILSACMFAYHVPGSHKGGQRTASALAGKPPVVLGMEPESLGKAASVNC